MIPGFSGGTMLLILGIYESFTSSLSKLLQKPKEAFGELWLYGIGASIGIVLGLLLCFLQQKFGLISLGGGNGSFVVDAYPVSVHLTDVLLVFVTVIAVGFLSVWYPVKYLSRRLLSATSSE